MANSRTSTNADMTIYLIVCVAKGMVNRMLTRNSQCRHSCGVWQFCSTVHTSSPSTHTRVHVPEYGRLVPLWLASGPPSSGTGSRSNILWIPVAVPGPLHHRAAFMSYFASPPPAPCILDIIRIWLCFIDLDSPFISTEYNSLIFCCAANRQELFKRSVFIFPFDRDKNLISQEMQEQKKPNMKK